MGPGILSKFLHKLEIAGVPHGLWATFMNWVGGLPHIPMLEAKMVLALSPSAVGVASFMVSNAGRLCRSGQIFSQRPWGQSSENCGTRFAF